MYEILRRSHERPWAPPDAVPDALGAQGQATSLVLRMRENRSQISRDGRAAITALAVLFMGTTLVFAFKGLWLVPLFSIAAMATLTFALDRHARGQAMIETLEFSELLVRHRDRAGRMVELPTFWLRLNAEQRTPSDLRLFLRSGKRQIEFGRCLSLDEKRAVVPIVEAAIARLPGR
ncbi:DUF2244 domain-containing protein [Novosphingobium mangrovi (ex Huang et al. 2023)]|uniref:DUF2244 domain-containing protein n=1 Tax=Novosphingobium mangrovi (ex Huang et al. 2023) TaxID=2976432 RepID=A0ABT2I0U7_9SPHN|nr:DUF2244 domain-containing protein [Novosphingobium mangrovi (ex Huang et al. 2023)]MCT2398431.1 DUF2244 domain-containing protein [Novosphingobium mangrovi (ex Huang et al. 2023)]